MGYLLFDTDSCKAAFAAEFAISFPLIPTWPGSQHTWPGSQHTWPGSQHTWPGSQHTWPGSQHTWPGSQHITISNYPFQVLIGDGIFNNL